MLLGVVSLEAFGIETILFHNLGRLNRGAAGLKRRLTE
jgi:hypothetical protein